MSRSGYSEDCDDQWAGIMYQGAVESARRGKRGQEFLRDLLAALDGLESKRLISEELVTADGQVCAIGALAVARGRDVSGIDPEDAGLVAAEFGIAEALAREVVYINDEAGWHETPEQRYARMRLAIEGMIAKK